MHSCEPVPPPPATGPTLLQQLGRLIIRARSVSPSSRNPRESKDPRDRLLQAKLRAANPSTSTQVVTQPKPAHEPRPAVEAQLESHVQALWNEQIPVCIEVLLAPNCPECYTSLTRIDEEGSYDRIHSQPRGLLLERWTMRALVNKPHENPAFITSQWLLNAVRSQLHFSQLSAWLSRLKGDVEEHSTERRRKLSREQCNYKKLESNCDETDPANEERKLNIAYSIKIPGESYKMAEFSRPPTDHTFPVTDIGNNVYLKVVLETLPRIDDIPAVKCTCQKRRASKEIPTNVHEELVGKLNDLSLEQKYSGSINSNIGTSSRRLSIISNPGSTEFLFKTTEDKKEENIVDDRMLTNCSENGKHKCNCDDESDTRTSTSFNHEPKKLDDKRLKEIAKYKRRLRKESKLKKLCDSTSSEGDNLKKETHTSIPILQAARFDRFRAIGCYRNQTYLTLPASRIETRSPFIDTISIPPQEFKRTVSVSTQTDDILCQCGVKVNFKCEHCKMVRSDANYDLASLNKDEKENGVRRKSEDEKKSFKKLKCDNLSSNIQCDNLVDDSVSFNDKNLIKRPKLRRFMPRVDRIEKILTDRLNKDTAKDMEQLHLKNDDTVFLVPKPETKRQKTYSINVDDYVLYEKCDYGTIDRCEMESPKDIDNNGFNFPEPNTSEAENIEKAENLKQMTEHLNQMTANLNHNLENLNHNVENLNHKDNVDPQVPSPSEMDRFRWRFDSAASMVFHTKTGLPLTSSPAPLRRGNNCFDFDDSINGISGIKSALFHPISPPPPAPPSPASPPAPRAASPPPRPKRDAANRRLRMGPSAGLLGSFEESALKGRLEPVATVAGFTAELGASGAFCPPHRRLPVTVFFYAPGGTNAPYMGHINLGPNGYRVARSGTIQVSLFNPHGTLVKMFVVLYDLTCMPPMARTFLRQRTLYMPAGAEPPAPHELYKWLRYLIHLRFMTSKSGKLYLHTDIRILVSRKADLDTATAHSALFRPISTNHSPANRPPANQHAEKPPRETATTLTPTNQKAGISGSSNRGPNRVFGGCGEYEESKMNIGYDNNQNGVSYELRSFTYAPENPRYSPR
ncbi:hypothetical protein O0L34_g13317 [Tuta absoluta]|nr:hypothetical protein O0L34_g13317 [Tuta absoluta]